jgi:acylphosphatase
MRKEIKHYRIRVFGRVQGVGFRYSARNKARELGLRGWVENLPDGSVAAAVQGDAEACNAFLRWCSQGTGYSWVERTEVTEKAPEKLKGFSIHR